jgi:hypothetical protein
MGDDQRGSIRRKTSQRLLDQLITGEQGSCRYVYNQLLIRFIFTTAHCMSRFGEVGQVTATK